MQRTDRNRRDVLKSLTASGAAISGISGLASAEEQQRNVQEITGSKKKKIVSQAISSPEVKKIRDHLEYPIRPNPQSGRAFKITQEQDDKIAEDRYKFAAINFEAPKSDDKSVFLSWNDMDEGVDPNKVVTIVSKNTQKERRLFISDGDVVDKKSDLKEVADKFNYSKKKSNQTSALSTEADGRECADYVYKNCENLNWSCISSIGLGYGECAYAVAAGSFAGVLFCLFAAGIYLWQVTDEENCSVCDSGELVEVDVCGPSSP